MTNSKKEGLGIIARFNTHSELRRLPRSMVISIGYDYFELPIDAKKFKRMDFEKMKKSKCVPLEGTFCGVIY